MEKEKIDYVEFPSRNLVSTKEFFTTVFGWSFRDYGQEYTSFSQAGLRGGFYQSELASTTQNGGALIVLYSPDLEDAQKRIIEAGGAIIKPTFSFPGGCRFHFADPNGNEYAVWSEK